MSYIFKFNENDKVINLVRTYPRVSFAFYNGTASYNNQYKLSGQFTSSILGAPNGYISLYEQNVDRNGTLDFLNAGIDANTNGIAVKDPFGYAVGDGVDPQTYYDGPNPRYATFKVRDGTRINFKTVSSKEFNQTPAGTPLFKDYPLTATVQKYYYSAAKARYTTSSEGGTLENPGDDVTGSITFLYALKNTMDYYKVLNPNYAFSSSVRDLGVSGPDGVEASLLTIPTIFYGDSIKKGTVDLKFYVTGTLVGQLKDINRNGNLIQVGPSGSGGSGSIGGVALYTEGFLVLTGSWDLTAAGTKFAPSHSEVLTYGTDHNFPSWINFAQTISSSVPPGKGAAPLSSCQMDFSGSHKIPTMMLFATAEKNELNHSNNPTYRDRDSQLLITSGSAGYIQNNKALIKNTTYSIYNDPTGSFKKTTYISKIGIYDRNKNLIAIAKVAKPVKKLEERELTFKLKLDM
jgi:hypothetical protein